MPMIQIPTTVAVDVSRALDEDVRTGDETVDPNSSRCCGQTSLITRDPV